MTADQCRRRAQHLRTMVNKRLATLTRGTEPTSMREACAYVLESGGKRVRAMLLLMACDAAGGDVRKALDAACAVEIMHNFTLVHDDIMDNAETRRGRPAVHVRWNPSHALLVGDVLLGLAYRTLLRVAPATLRTLAELFTVGVLEVCEGQALDLEFERLPEVTVKDYFRMIEKKTGRLIALATEMGAVIGGATPRRRTALRAYGAHLGRAFQLQDDLLDVVADAQVLGKPIGGDIAGGKRTYLLLTAAERAAGDDCTLLAGIMAHGARTPEGPDGPTIAAVTGIYERTGVLQDTRDHIAHSTRDACAALRGLPRNAGTEMLRWLADELDQRSS